MYYVYDYYIRIELKFKTDINWKQHPSDYRYRRKRLYRIVMYLFEHQDFYLLRMTVLIQNLSLKYPTKIQIDQINYRLIIEKNI